MHLDPESRIRNADAIADYAVKQAGLVKELIDRKTFVLANLMGNKYCAGLEITILDPDLDPQGQYTREFVRHVGNCIRTSLAKRDKS